MGRTVVIVVADFSPDIEASGVSGGW